MLMGHRSRQPGIHCSESGFKLFLESKAGIATFGTDHMNLKYPLHAQAL